MAITTPDTYPLALYKGATWRKTFTLHTGEDDSTPLRDLTGYAAALVVRDQAGGTQLMSLSSTGGTPKITLGGALGTITILQSVSDIAALTWSIGKYLLTITASGGDTEPLLIGDIRVVAT